MSYQYPEQDPTQIPTFGTTGFWADAGEEYVDYSPDALAYHQQATTSASSSSAPQKESRTSKSRHHKRKESKTSSSYQSGSDTEKESRGKMSSRSSRHQPSGSSRREKAPKPSKKANDDWSEVTDPEERRRIQNKIAQRKFREKTRERKERDQRDATNQANAKYSYEVPSPNDLPADQDNLSGLPWGGIGMGAIMSKGHATASHQGSRRESDPTMINPNAYLSPYGGGYTQMSSWDGTTGGGSSGDDGTVSGGGGVAGGGGFYTAGGSSGDDTGGSPYYHDYDYGYEGGGARGGDYHGHM